MDGFSLGALSGGDEGGEEETPGHVLLSRFRRTTRVSEQPFYVILYIEQWRFRCTMRQTVANEDPEPRCTGFADGGLPMGSIPGSARVMEI